MKTKKVLLAFIVSSFCVPVWGNGSGRVVAVIDTGFDKSYSARYLGKSACFSEEEKVRKQITYQTQYPTPIIRSDITTTSHLYDGNIMSKCPNGKESQSGSSSSYGVNMPTRKIYRDIVSRNYELINNNAFYYNSSFENYYSDVTVKHGTNVAKQVAIYAPSARIFPITIGSINRRVNCGILDTISEEYNQSSPDYYVNHYDKLIRATGCGNSYGEQILDSLKHVLKNTSSVTAVNVSVTVSNPTFCSTQQGKDTVTALNNRGIAVVAAVGNTNGQNVEWPACLPNVIGVAQINAGGAVVDSSIRDNKQDFFMVGSMSDYKTGSNIQGTSFASPKVAGIYASLKSINPNASITDITNVLTQTGSSVGNFAGKRINYQRAVNEIKKITGTPPPTDPPSDPPPTDDPDPTPPSQPPTPPGQTAVLGFTDDTRYRGAVNLTINLNGSATTSSLSSKTSLTPLSNANISVTNVRDIKLNFDGKFYTGLNPSSLQGVDIFVNGVKRFNFNSIQYAASSIDGFNLPFRKHTFMLNRNWLKSGDNTISMKRAKPTDAFHFSVTKIRMDYNSPIDMRLGQTITSLYGHRVGSKKHLTGLRVEFASPSKDIEFSATGYDIDSATEIAVFLNQKHIGYLKRGSSSRYNAGDVFNLGSLMTP